MEAKIRVMIADDHAVVREGIHHWISAQKDMEVVGEAEDGEQAWRLAKSLLPEILVLDVSMPKMNGPQVAERLRQICPEVKIIALSAYQDEAHVRQLLASGARGYVLKKAIAEDLTNAIRAVHSGGFHLDPHVTNKVVQGYIDPTTVTGEATLSPREREVAVLMAWGHSNKEIAGQLHLSVKTVESHKTRLMEKLELKSRTDLVRYAVRCGWMKEE